MTTSLRGQIRVSKMQCAEHWGDWHDKPCRWRVDGPGSELQKFSTRKDAEAYATYRRQSPDQFAAISGFSSIP